MTAVLEDLQGLADTDLADMYPEADDQTRAAVLAEFARRDQADRLERARATLARIRHEAECAVHAQFLAASELCRGRLLSRAGIAAGVTERDLWRLPTDRAARFMAEELADYFAFVSPRITVASYIRQHAAESRAARTEALDQAEAIASDDITEGITDGHEHSTGRARLAHHEPSSLRRQPPAAEAPEAGGRGTVLGGRRGAEHDAEARHAEARARRPGRPTQPASRMTGRDMTMNAVTETARDVDPRVAGYFERARAAQAAEPGTVAVLDGQVVARHPSAPARAPKPIDGALVLGLVRRYLSHYVAFPSDAALNAAVAWIAHAAARDRDDKGIGQLIWRASPRLLVTSRNRGSGKSTLLDLIVILTKSRDGKTPKVTPRAIAETTGQQFETVVLDEAKTLFGSGAKNLELQGILLAGYTPRTSYRVKGKSIPLFGAVAYAGKDELITNTEGGQIGDLLDRSITLRFRGASVVTPEVDEIAEDDGDMLASALIAWTDSVRAELRQAAKDIAAEDREASEEAAAAGAAAGNVRTVQIWRPLRAIARVAGGDWPEDVDAASWELTAGAASSEAQDALDELQRRAAAWGTTPADDEPGEIVTEPGGEDD